MTAPCLWVLQPQETVGPRFWAIAAAGAGCFDHPPALSATKHLDHPPLHLSLPPLQVLDDMNKARTEDLSEITPNLSGLKPKLV